MERIADVAVVGAGIAGLAHAYHALRKGLRVVLFDREEFAIGASIRNFGLLWPIGQEPGVDLERALRSRNHWSSLAGEAGFWLNETGSLHLAYHPDELAVLEEYVEMTKGIELRVQMLNAQQVSAISPMAKTTGLLGGMLSTTEATVYSRDAVRKIPLFLHERYGLITRFGQLVTDIQMPRVKTSVETWNVEKVIVCSGADFQTLYPELFAAQGIQKCKLQMMRAIGKQVSLGPSPCAGLTLLHYAAFRNCKSLLDVRKRYDAELPYHREKGIHVLVSQNPYGDLIIGDSHEYGQTLEPFDSEKINEAIIEYLNTFLSVPGLSIIERWNGVYPKLSSGTYLIASPEKGVTIVNGFGGAGMTLSFGVAEEVVNGL